MKRAVLRVLGIVGLTCVWAMPLTGQAPIDPEFEAIRQKATIEPKLDAEIPKDIKFRDPSGKEVAIGDYFNGERPVLLSIIYFTCPMLCGLQTQDMVAATRELGMSWTPGKEFDIVIVSMDPRDDAAAATDRKKKLLELYGRPETEAGWHLLTGQAEEIKRLADTIGFGYVWQEERGEYAHEAGLFITTAEGRVAHFLGDLGYSSSTMKTMLLQAGEGKVGTFWEKIGSLCVSWDPTTGKFTATAIFIVQVAGGVTVMFLLGLVLWARKARGVTDTNELVGTQ